jgi:hypothetical protein
MMRLENLLTQYLESHAVPGGDRMKIMDAYRRIVEGKHKALPATARSEVFSVAALKEVFPQFARV